MKIAYYLPKNKITNSDLFKYSNNNTEWSNEKIIAKCGIKIRHKAENGEFVSHMCIKACKKLFDEYEIKAEEIDFIILCTQTPDYLQPATAFLIASGLGLRKNIGAFDINIACSGYIYALCVAKGLIVAKMAKKVLICTAEYGASTSQTGPIAQRILFSDGASATLLDTNSINRIYTPVFGSDGDNFFLMHQKFGGCAHPINKQNFDEYINSPSPFTAELKGPEIFLFTLREVPQLVKNTLEANNFNLDEIDFFIFHQANILILERAIKALNLPREKAIIDIEEVGNTGSSSIPIAIKRALENGTIKNNKKALLAGFGTGLSLAGVVIAI